MDESILLNFTSKISFEETDPLMSLVNAKKPLLFYDRLSVEMFPADNEQKCLLFVKKKFSDLRNLLEARSFSSDDNDGRIRLIIIIDLTDGLFHEKGKLVFPAQKVRKIRDVVRDVFGNDNPILRRLEYAFVFISGDTDDPESTKIYLNNAYGGYEESYSLDEGKSLKHYTDEVIEKLDSPDEDQELNDASIKHQIDDFIDNRLTVIKDRINKWLDRTKCADKFQERFDCFMNQVKTVEDFKNSDFEEEMRTYVRELIGLCASEFHRDCVFFILKVREEPRNVYLKDELYVKALVQLLCTINADEYNNRFKNNNANQRARLFVLTDTSIENINIEELKRLYIQVGACLPKLRNLKWSEEMDVKYKVFSSNIAQPIDTDTHRKLNDDCASERDKMQSEFDKVRRIPFFFGKKPDDWSWYRAVIEKITRIYNFETENNRPLYDAPKRITYEEMGCIDKTTTYRRLELDKKNLEEKHEKIELAKDIHAYMKEREKNLSEWPECISRLKKEMKKLGFSRCLFWIGLFSLLGFTICYAYHFLGLGNSDSFFMVALGTGVSGVLFLLSSIIGQNSVKERIQASFIEINNKYKELQKMQENFLQGMNNHYKAQNDADVRQRNLNEMEEKINGFKTHNKSIDLWIEHFTSIQYKIKDTLDALLAQKPYRIDQSSNKTLLNENSFDLTMFPAIPDVIRSDFENMKLSFSSYNIQIESVICFVKKFDFTEKELIN